MRLTHISPLSAAKVAFVLYGLIGLLIGVIFAAISLLTSAVGLGVSPEAGGPFGNHSALFGAMFGVGAVIILPIFYGCLGAVGALLSTFLYNVVAGLVGGIELTIEPAPLAR